FVDLDGTLADSLPVMRLAYWTFLQSFKHDASDAEFDSINGPPLHEVVRRLKVSHALDEHEDVLLSKYFDTIDLIYADVKPSDGAVNFLQKAREHQCIIGVVTSNTRKRTQSWLKTVHLFPMIDFIVSG